MSEDAQSLILNASDNLMLCLGEVGKKKHLTAAEILFHEDGDNVGVFLVIDGTVRMSVKGLPKLDRIFGSGSVLGLPSTFTERPYTLTATAITEADVVHVTQGDFLRLMVERPDLCREATEILGREMGFIHSALIDRRRHAESMAHDRGDVAVA
jgi:CRP-like cAMP-binding protein